MLFVLVNHDPQKSVLRKTLVELDPCPSAAIRFASASLLGYGLFGEGLIPPEDAVKRLDEWGIPHRE